MWDHAGPPGPDYNTVAKWHTPEWDFTCEGKAFRGSKRPEWLRILGLPGRTGAPFEMAANVESVTGDLELLRAHG